MLISRLSKRQKSEYSPLAEERNSDEGVKLADTKNMRKKIVNFLNVQQLKPCKFIAA